MSLKGIKIGFAITGSSCNFESIFPEIERLAISGADLYPIASEAAATFDTRFGTGLKWMEKFEEITGKKVITTIVDAEPVGPKLNLDVLVVAPCTGNTAAKLANAITDTPVTMAVKAHLRNNKPVVLAIATNDGLGANAKNIGALMNMKNIYFVPFGQDDAIKKPKSLISKFDQIQPAIENALSDKQVQPLLV